jgi:hypothetical protein
MIYRVRSGFTGALNPQPQTLNLVPPFLLIVGTMARKDVDSLGLQLLLQF